MKVNVTYKVCNTCQRRKPIDRFFKRGGDERGYRSKCKDCFQESGTRYNQQDQVKARRAQHMREYRARDRSAWLNSSLKYRFNITLDEWNRLFDDQDGRCAICDHEFTKKTPHVDHCHETGVIRGLLCGGCNRMLGQARDSARILRKGAEYLEGQC